MTQRRHRAPRSGAFFRKWARLAWFGRRMVSMSCGMGRLNRPVVLLVHRYVGLALASFLLIEGVTGSLLAWNDELEALVSPNLFVVAPPAAAAPMLDPIELRALAAARVPHVQFDTVPLHLQAGRAVIFPVDPPTQPEAGVPRAPDDQIFVNPYTGAILGSRKEGDLTQGLVNALPFVYRLHDSLAFGETGSLVLGGVALLWTADCFVGAWLTFPARARGKPTKSWWRRWRHAWLVRWRGGAYKIKFDLHRAGGLWIWVMLFVLAWSGVSFNLAGAYDPVMTLLFSQQTDPQRTGTSAGSGLVGPCAPRERPRLDWLDARAAGRRLMAEQASKGHFRILREQRLSYDESSATYSYRVRSTRDVSARRGTTEVVFDAHNGALRGVWLPTGAASGDTVSTWLKALHRNELGGRAYQVFLCVIGLLVAMLSVTGTLIWLKKRGNRRLVAQGKRPKSSGSGAEPSTSRRAAKPTRNTTDRC